MAGATVTGLFVIGDGQIQNVLKKILRYKMTWIGLDQTDLLNIKVF